jgi:hypothetical protein
MSAEIAVAGIEGRQARSFAAFMRDQGHDVLGLRDRARAIQNTRDHSLGQRFCCRQKSHSPRHTWNSIPAAIVSSRVHHTSNALLRSMLVWQRVFDLDPLGPVPIFLDSPPDLFHDSASYGRRHVMTSRPTAHIA